MATTSRIMHGSRAKVYIIGANGTQLIGIFNNVTYQRVAVTQAAFILGRFGPASIEYTGKEPVQLNCSGYRVVDHGAHTEPGVPTVQEFLTFQDLTITVVDRGTGKTILTAIGCKPHGDTGGFTQRQLSEIQITYIGLTDSDESKSDAEPSDSSSLPS